MPSKFGHHGRKRSRGIKRHAAAIMQLPVAKKMIEAQPSDAEAVPRAQIGRRDARAGDRHPAQTVRLPRERIEHRGVVATVRAALHQDPARKSNRIEHAKIFFERRIRRRVAAIRSVWKSLPGSEHMGMGVAGHSWWRHLWP